MSDKTTIHTDGMGRLVIQTGDLKTVFDNDTQAAEHIGKWQREILRLHTHSSTLEAVIRCLLADLAAAKQWLADALDANDSKAAEVGRLTCEIGGHQDTIRTLRAEVREATDLAQSQEYAAEVAWKCEAKTKAEAKQVEKIAEEQLAENAKLKAEVERLKAIPKVKIRQDYPDDLQSATPPAKPQPERCPRCGGVQKSESQPWCAKCGLECASWSEWAEVDTLRSRLYATEKERDRLKAELKLVRNSLDVLWGLPHSDTRVRDEIQKINKHIEACLMSSGDATPPAKPQPERCPRCEASRVYLNGSGWIVCGCGLPSHMWPEWAELVEAKKAAGGK